MRPVQAVCNYALLRFVPYPQTGEAVNIGVVVNCIQPCFLDFEVEERMPDRVRGVFPDYTSASFEAAVKAIAAEVKRISAGVRDPKDCQRAFIELVRPRENTYRFGEVRTAVAEQPAALLEELFRRYVRMTGAGTGVL